MSLSNPAERTRAYCRSAPAAASLVDVQEPIDRPPDDADTRLSRRPLS